MILIGNQRGGARDLAAHLLKDENDHVSVHELRGFVASDLKGALREVEALSRATRCKQYLFSLSLNPPPDQQVRTETFESAIDQAEERLGLGGQPRAVVFHEKEGRRHAHAVWSRIDPDTMKAIQLSHSGYKLRDLSRQLYREHGWDTPRGMTDRSLRDPKNYSLEEWQQCQRQGVNPREIKAAIQEAWAISDSPAALTHALEDRGLTLARGDRRGFVAVDHTGEPYALARYAGVKARDIRQRLGGAAALPSMDEARDKIARGMIAAMERLKHEAAQKDQAEAEAFEARKQALITRQRAEREQQAKDIESRHWAEARERQARFRPGLKGVWDHLRGEHRRITRQNEHDAYQAHLRDRAQKDALILSHIDQRKNLDQKREQARQQAKALELRLEAQRQHYETLRKNTQAQASAKLAFDRAAQPHAPPGISARHQEALSRLRQRPTARERLHGINKNRPAPGPERERER
ncbi:relaxase/mobilization nuclease domain-containing protein [Woodsholea maritima]|uniref:relaxase/mobilization nuclease domain-containing protein n=1 Tax=Woodsholea maritima TaxID=240237 RepID=UPI00037E01BE|nr:relaxase/mobilization nuclease domain-containing protein [Woodsholea maritima]